MSENDFEHLKFQKRKKNIEIQFSEPWNLREANGTIPPHAVPFNPDLRAGNKIPDAKQ